MSIKYKKKFGYGFVEYKSKNLNFAIFQPPGSSGYVEVIDKGKQIFVSESGNHEDRILDLRQRAKSLEREAKLLKEAADTMEKYKYDIPQ